MKLERPSPEKEKTTFNPEINQVIAREQYQNAQLTESDSPFLIYRERVAENVEFLIYKRSSKLELQLIEDNHKIAEFIFTETDVGFDMEHRLVESQHLGITGSLFLKKAESYFDFLIQNNLAQDKPLLIEAGQKKVVEWALKNGFTFANGNEAELFQKINDGALEYQTEVIDTTENTVTKSGYILSNEVYEKWSEENKRRAESSEDLIPAKHASVRFHLKKTLRG